MGWRGGNCITARLSFQGAVGMLSLSEAEERVMLFLVLFSEWRSRGGTLDNRRLA